MWGGGWESGSKNQECAVLAFVVKIIKIIIKMIDRQ